ncbi:MAG TPA: squalene synthase HpnC [Ignavibacteriaceae bacterium]
MPVSRAWKEILFRIFLRFFDDKINRMRFDLNKGYEEAEQLANTHYENFPVVSFLLPHQLKKHIAIIYWFARSADDIADEGSLAVSERLGKLGSFMERFESILSKQFNNNLEYCLVNTIEEKNLSPQYFFDLLTAFRQDVTKNRYENFEEVLGYCRHSANPVGRLILELFSYRDEKLNLLSDKICTALQLTNFLQDTIIDFKKGRIYLPKDEMHAYNITETMFELKEINHNLAQLIRHNLERTENLFEEGRELLNYLSGGLKIEIAWTINGGTRILEKIKSNNYDVIKSRPSLTKTDYLKVLFKSFFP